MQNIQVQLEWAWRPLGELTAIGWDMAVATGTSDGDRTGHGDGGEEGEG